MDIFDQKMVLESFTILRDSREQDTERARRRYAAMGVPCERATLSYGDYTYNAILPDGKPLHDLTGTINPLCAVERKMNLDELAQCFTRGRDRFQREFERAAEHGCRVYLIVENGSWEHLLNGKYRSKLNPDAFKGSLDAWMVRYNTNVIFCKEETTGERIRSILFRDLKERLEQGEFDGN